MVRLLAVTELATSNKEARRKIEQGAVRLDGGEGRPIPTSRSTADDVDGQLLSVGKRSWARVVVAADGRRRPRVRTC